MTTAQWNILLGAIAGGVAGLLTQFIVPGLRRHLLFVKLHFKQCSKRGTRGTARICNCYVLPLSGAVAYINVENDAEDVIEPPKHFTAFIGPGNAGKVEDDRLCWSSTAPVSNPAIIDIYGGEEQALDIVDIQDGYIEIPSEDGWASNQTENQVNVEKERRKNSRVFLKRKKYRAEIKIVSKDAKAKVFQILIDPEDAMYPIRFERERDPYEDGTC